MTLQDQIEFLECPRCHGDLTNQAEPAALSCTACGTRYPKSYGKAIAGELQGAGAKMKSHHSLYEHTEV